MGAGVIGLLECELRALLAADPLNSANVQMSQSNEVFAEEMIVMNRSGRVRSWRMRISRILAR
jgi:hypothetical protein